MTSRVWFITGASAGFGKLLAEALLARGEQVAGTMRQAEQAAAFTRSAPERALGIVMDVTDEAQVQAAIQAAVERFSRIDVLVNNAGHGMIGAVEETSDAEARALFDVNVFGALHVLRHGVPVLRGQGRGLVINFSSQGGIRGFGGSSLYCATKFALEAISEGLLAEAGHLGIRVMLVEPGGFRTEFLGRSMRVVEREVEAYAPTVGQRRANLSKLDGKQPGDPVKGITLLLEAVDAPEPPFRIVMGTDAVSNVRWKLDTLSKDLTAWEARSLATDFPAEG